MLGFLLLFLSFRGVSESVLNQVPQRDETLLIFFRKNRCLAVQLGAKQA